MQLWEAESTKIKNGESIQSSSYTYEIVKELNDGKMAVAYHAKRSDGQNIFLKHTKDPNNYSDSYSSYVKSQHQILSILNAIGTSHVEKNYEYFEYKGRHFQAKEFLNGVDLKSILWTKNKNDQMNFTTRFNLIERLAELIKLIHEKDLIHSDLKPEQIFMIKDSSQKSGYRVRLIDFDHSIVPSLNIYIPAGTPTWYSPEHNRTNKTVGAYSDVFTLGNMFYTIMAFGRKPFQDFIDSDSKYRSAITKTKSVTPLKTLNKAYPEEL
ncbi:MAG: protein kinase, partial [Campylobacterota bacterium]|nr:protein kinase [Campylobacterota bacterium]